MRIWHRVLLSVVIGAGLVAAPGCGYFTSPEERVARAETMIGSGDHRRALIELRNALQKKPDLARARLLLAEVALWLGDSAGAARELLRVPPEFEPARREDLGLRIDLVVGRYAEIISQIPAPSADTAPERMLYRAQALQGLGKHAEAEQEIRALLLRAPGLLAAKASLIELRAVQGDYAGALELARAMTREHPDSALAWFVEGALLARGVSLPEAETALDRAVKTAPRQLDVPRQVSLLATLIEVRIANRNLDAARVSAGMLAGIVPKSPLAGLMSARVSMAANDYATAGSELRRVVNATPQFARARFMLGVALAAEGNLEQASQELTVVVDQMPENLEARQLLAQIRMRLEDPSGALRVLVPALEANADDRGVNLLFEEARLQSAVSDGGRSLELLETEYRKSPGNRGLRLQLASAYLAGNAPAKALALLRELDTAAAADPIVDRLLLAAIARVEGEAAASRKLDALLAARPGDADLAVLAAQMRLAVGDAERADALLTAALKRKPEHEGARLALARLQIARGQRAVAIENLNLLRRGTTRATEARLLLAQLALQRDDAKQADDLIAEAVRGASNIADTHNAAGNIYLGTARYDAAIEHFRAGATADPTNARLWLNLGRAQLALEQVDAARESLQRALALRKHWLPAEGVLTFLELQQGHPDAALARVAELKKAFPNDAAVLVLEAEVYAAQRQFLAAEQALTAAARLQPTATLAVKAYQVRVAGELARPTEPLEKWIAAHPEEIPLRNLLAEAQVRAGAKRDAATQYEQIVAHQPRDVVALNNLAWLYFELEDRRAVALGRRAYALAPEAPAVADTLGWILVQSGQLTEGLEILRNAAVSAPTSGDLQYHYAAALAKAGKADEAQARLRTLLESPEKFASRTEAEQLLASLGKGQGSAR